MIGLGLIYPRAAGKRRVRNPPSRTCGRGGRPGMPRHVTWVRKCIAAVYVSMLLCGLFTAGAPHAVYTCRAAHTYGSTGGSCWGAFCGLAWPGDLIAFLAGTAGGVPARKFSIAHWGTLVKGQPPNGKGTICPCCRTSRTCSLHWSF